MFAQIAHSGIRGRREQLVQPVPNDPKAQVCTLQPCSGLPTRTPQRSQTAEELANELTQARTWAAKFLQPFSAASHKQASPCGIEGIPLYSARKYKSAIGYDPSLRWPTGESNCLL